MSRTVRNPIFLTGLVLLLTRCAVADTCSSTFVALPSAILGAHVYLTTVDSADTICRQNGFSKAGSIRTSTLSIMGLSVSAVRLQSLEIVTPLSTEILVAVECLKAGQKACAADSDGNIGSDNKGKNNFGTKNNGDDNIEVPTAAILEVPTAAILEVPTTTILQVSSAPYQNVSTSPHQGVTTVAIKPTGPSSAQTPSSTQPLTTIKRLSITSFTTPTKSLFCTSATTCICHGPVQCS
ncbi:hypothetical protein ACKKBG_A08695 [Auxenochlorella protothecoides x Auxenochlorella symbiontica]